MIFLNKAFALITTTLITNWKKDKTKKVLLLLVLLITVAIFASCTEGSSTAQTSVALPTSVTKIGSFAFCNCTALSGVYFAGTKAEWESISKGEYWDGNTADCTVYCIDGEIDKE